MSTTLAVSLPVPLGKRLEALARKTGRSETFYAAEAISCHLEELEDVYLALERLENPGKRYTLMEARKALGLED